MSSGTDDEGRGFMILSDGDFERLKLEERLEYMRTAVVAVQRLQKQIQRIMDEFAKRPQP
jgi:hypothetical protein